LTEHVGFIPNNIIDRSLLISVKRPAEDILAGMADVETTCVEPTQNLKNLYYNFNTDSGSQTSLTKIVCGNIIDKITSYTFTNEFRDAVYDILIYDLDAVECFWFVFVHMSKQKTIDGSLMNKDISIPLPIPETPQQQLQGDIPCRAVVFFKESKMIVEKRIYKIYILFYIIRL
jgi:hypothetical protein